MRNVVVTGLGVVVRDASNVSLFRHWLMHGGGIPDTPSHLDTSPFRARKAYSISPDSIADTLASRIEAFGLPPVGKTDMDCAGYGLLAATEALNDAGLSAELRDRCGISLATTSGGLMDNFVDALAGGEDYESFVHETHPGAAAKILSRVFGLGGPKANFSCACASSPVAFSYAFSRLRRGDTPLMLVGGSDRLRAADFAGFNALRSMDRDKCRPFDIDRAGMIIGDGSAMLVLEDEEHAIARGAPILARLVSIGLALDAHHITQPNPDGLHRAMQQALDGAGLGPQSIGYVNCHGTGTPANDRAEAMALSYVFTAEKPLVSSTKGVTGHLLGTAGAIEAIITILALKEGAAPAMTSTENPEDTGFEMPATDAPRAFEGRYAMSNSLGFGGINASMIFELRK